MAPSLWIFNVAKPCASPCRAVSSTIQRMWRDSEVASRHALVEPEIAKQAYGRALFGNYEPITLL